MLSLADPDRRRRLQAEEVGGEDKEVVKDYFNNSGFQRWKKIYGETDDVNRVQRDIRLGHAKTVENAIKMLTDEGQLRGVTVCDAGCGTGSLSIPLAKEGAIVSASDISAAMVAEAEKQVSLVLVYKCRNRFLKLRIRLILFYQYGVPTLIQKIWCSDIMFPRINVLSFKLL